MGKGSGSGGRDRDNKDVKKITLEELSEHRTQDNAWISYRGKVYDVSGYNDHPGGSVIFTHAGDDATDIFAAFHPGSAHKELEKFYIGDLDESVIPKGLYANKFKPAEQKAFEAGYRRLRDELIKMGMFNASPMYYIYKVLSTTAIAAFGIYLATSTDHFMTNMAGAIVIALFWQQCGWLAHDFLHHQVFKNRVYGDLMGIVVGNIFQGFSVQWWKGKHNAHHAVPNLHASSPDAHDGDPDIDTMPLLAWTKVMADSAKDSKWGRFFIRFQAILYFPILFFARLSWANESLKFVFGKSDLKGADIDKANMQYPVLEKLGLIIHYAILFSVMYQMPAVNALCFFFLAETMCGLFLALVFGLGHNGMAVYPANERPDFWKLQVTTTRNVTSNPFVDWFCGGLQYQVDHHLFPMLPRHNLAKVHKLVEQFCKEFGVTYHETNMYDGTVEVLTHLSEVSSEFLQEFPAM